MKILLSALALSLVTLVGGCASTDVTDSIALADQVVIAQPGRIIVYDFAATASDVSPTSTMTGHYVAHSTAQTAEEIEQGRVLGAQVAGLLVQELNNEGIFAERAGAGIPPRIGDVLVSGQFFSIDEGSQRRRLMIGFGRGANELQTHVEAYVLTSSGQQLLGTRSIDAGGGKSPGLVVPGAMAVVSGSPVGIIVSTGLAIRRERGSENLSGAAGRTAEAITEEVVAYYRSRGWL